MRAANEDALAHRSNIEGGAEEDALSRSKLREIGYSTKPKWN